MQLRTTVQRPNRYEEEYDSRNPQITPARLKSIHKSTIPAYPDLLLRQATCVRRQPRSAAFPSLPLKRKRKHSLVGQVTQKNNEPRNIVVSYSQNITPLHNPNTLLPRDGSRPRNSGESGDHQELAVKSDETSQQKPERQPHAQISTHLPDVHMTSKVCWNCIEPGLQLYIFDSLLPQFLLPEFIGEVLGLNPAELMDIDALKRRRILQPANTEALWNYCRSIGGVPESFVDPTVMQKYVDYFAFASQFESTSVVQRQTAVVFLRQRRIEGAFVEALLPSRPGIWTRPEYALPAQLLYAAQLGVPPSDEEVEWLLMLSEITVHESHYLGKVAEYFKSSYFPASLRRQLLSKPLWNLDALSKWLMYGPESPSTEETDASGGNSAEDMHKAVPASALVPNTLSDTFKTLRKEAAKNEADKSQSQRTILMLHKITRDTDLLEAIGHKLNQSPLNRRHIEIIYVLASQLVRPDISNESRASSLQSLEDGTLTAFGAFFMPSSRSTDLAEVNSGSATGQGQNTASIGAATAPRIEKEKNYPSMTHPESGRLDRKLASEITDTREEAGMTSKTVTPMDSIGESSEPRSRATSEQSHRTAQDSSDVAEINTRSTNYLASSPSPPPWSPITDEGSGVPNLQDLFNQVSPQAIEKLEQVPTQTFTHQKHTPQKNTSGTIQQSSIVLEHLQTVTPAGVENVASGSPLLEQAEPQEDSWKVLTTSEYTQPTLSSFQKGAKGDQVSRDPTKTVTEKRHQPNKQTTTPVSSERSELLSGIHEAATLASPSSISSNVDPLSLETSSPPKKKRKSQKPPPSTSKKTVILSEPLKPSKRQKKTDSRVGDQATPQKQTKIKKLALLLQTPATQSTAASATTPVRSITRGQYKTRSDKGKKRGPYGRRKSSVSPTKGLETGSGEAENSKAAK